MQKTLPFSSELNPNKAVDAILDDLWVELTCESIDGRDLLLTMAMLLSVVEYAALRSRGAQLDSKKLEENMNQRFMHLENPDRAMWVVHPDRVWAGMSRFVLRRFRYQLLTPDEVRRRTAIRTGKCA